MVHRCAGDLITIERGAVEQTNGILLQLLAQCDETLSHLTDEHDHADPEFIADAECRAFRYPVLEYPVKVTAINLDKTPQMEGTLLGIKGQYLILDSGVLNVRKYGGYEIELSV